VGLRDQLKAGVKTGVKSALARWVLHKRRGLFDGQQARPAPHDEATHAWDGRRRFAEDYSFVALQSELGLLVRLEWLPGRAAHRLWVVALLPDEACCNPQAQAVVADASSDRWNVAGLELDCLRPLASWSVRYRGALQAQRDRDDRGIARIRPQRACELELVFEADRAPFVPGVDDDPELVARRLGEAAWDAELIRSVRRASQRGYVQLGTLSGVLSLGDHRIDVHAQALRQHNWGVRDWGAPDRAVQCFAIGDGARTWIQRAQFPAFTLEGGFVDRERATAIHELLRIDDGGDDRGLELSTPDGPLRWQGRRQSGLELRVDGRGALELVLARGEGDRAALWATQRRTLPGLVPRR
jgi:hypothetical protein